MTQPEPVTILLAEQLALVRDGLAALCALRPHWHVVAQCGDGAEALDQIGELRPDIAILDLHLPNLYCLEVVRRMQEQGLSTRSIVLSDRQDRKTVMEALRTGASGLVLKSGPGSEFLEAIRMVAEGGVFVSPTIEVGRMFTTKSKQGPEDPIDSLSAREYQVFSLLIDGMRAKEIAGRLDLSPKTVDTYRASMMRKLDIHDVAGLVKFAIQRKLIAM
ncbi:MAG: response regulator transcription factor [Bryobacteraceae bacterium]|nr:response regulator transcription factor [Bryobacteraceae bacterium]